MTVIFQKRPPHLLLKLTKASSCPLQAAHDERSRANRSRPRRPVEFDVLELHPLLLTHEGVDAICVKVAVVNLMTAPNPHHEHPLRASPSLRPPAGI